MPASEWSKKPPRPTQTLPSKATPTSCGSAGGGTSGTASYAKTRHLHPRYWPREPSVHDSGAAHSGIMEILPGVQSFAHYLYGILQARGAGPLACFVEGGEFIKPVSAPGGDDARGPEQQRQRILQKVPRKGGGPKRRRRSRIMKAPAGLKFSKVT